jgi:hypothetical protein
MKRLYAIIALLSLQFGLFGQETPVLSKKERDEQAVFNILNLEKGILVFQLKTEAKKMAELERLINSPDVTEKSKYRLRKEKSEAEAIRKKFNEDLIAGIKANYEFSDFMVINDVDAEFLKENPSKINIIESSNPSLDLNTSFYLLVKESWTSGSGLEALIIHDRFQVPLQQPFPYYYKINSIDRLFLSLFSAKTYYRKSADKITKKLNSSLYKFKERLVLKENKS